MSLAEALVGESIDFGCIAREPVQARLLARAAHCDMAAQQLEEPLARPRRHPPRACSLNLRRFRARAQILAHAMSKALSQDGFSVYHFNSSTRIQKARRIRDGRSLRIGLAS